MAKTIQREFPEAPIVGIGAVVVDEGRVLLVQRNREPSRGRWSLPGGMLELGESLEQGVKREVVEETGLEVEAIELVELVDRVFREEAEDGRVRYHYVIADYLCRVVGGTLKAASDAAAVRWIERTAWNANSGDLNLDSITIRVIEKGWQRAQEIDRAEKERR